MPHIFRLRVQSESAFNSSFPDKLSLLYYSFTETDKNYLGRLSDPQQINKLRIKFNEAFRFRFKISNLDGPLFETNGKNLWGILWTLVTMTTKI